MLYIVYILLALFYYISFSLSKTIISFLIILYIFHDGKYFLKFLISCNFRAMHPCAALDIHNLGLCFSLFDHGNNYISTVLMFVLR